MENINKENYKRIYTVLSILIVLIVLSTLISIIKKQDRQITSDTQYTIMRETVQIKNSIESSVGYAFNSIQVTSSEISKRMTGDELENPSEMLGEYLSRTPFTSIEYIRADGLNTTDAGEPFDASSREYYIKGISGKTGIWVNYTPKYSKEPLLNFYTPLIYEGRIVGVLTGTLGGDTTISPLLLADYLGETTVGVIFDEDNNVISCSESNADETDLSCENIGLLANHKEEFSELLGLEQDTVIRLKCKDGMGIGYLSIIPTTGWKLIEVVPANSLNAIKNDNNRFVYIMLATVIVTFIVYFSFVIGMNKRLFSKDIQRANAEKEEQFNILKSMSEVYYSMHLIDLTKNTVTEYSARNEVKEIVNSKADAAVQMRAIMTATVEDEYLDRVLEFTDLSALSERMNGKKNISIEFIAKNYGWFRGEFISVETDEKTGCPIKVAFTTQLINEEKRKEEELKLQSSTDGLTGLFNRRAYAADIANWDIEGSADTLVYLAVDINGLKAVNDKLGHKAGDELIKGAAECIVSCFKDYGKAYRTGGDEMVAVFQADKTKLDELKADFAEIVSGWSGEFVDSLSVSCGYVSSEEYPDKPITELANIADKRMYEAKAAYYKSRESSSAKN